MTPPPPPAANSTQTIAPANRHHSNLSATHTLQTRPRPIADVPNPTRSAARYKDSSASAAPTVSRIPHPVPPTSDTAPYQCRFLTGAVQHCLPSRDRQGASPSPDQYIDPTPNEEIKSRQRPEHRLPQQIAQFNQLMDYILMVKDAPHLRGALQVHFERLANYYKAFTSTIADPEAE